MQRRKHSAEFKQQVVQEAIETGNKALVASYLTVTSSRYGRQCLSFRSLYKQFSSKKRSYLV
ncbi:transposase [Bacillus subtilis]|nr:transposase [Bacillus subtilis]MED3695764.1 transposase [Bacillus subtilis]